MTSKIILFSCAVSLVFATASAGDLKIGFKGRGVLVYSEIHEKPAQPFVIDEEVVTVEVTDNGNIKAVSVQDIQGDGTSSIESGGVGEEDVGIKLVGKLGKGYKFQVDVYATFNYNMGLLEFGEWTNQTDLFSDKSRMCSKLHGLTPGQRRVCRRHKDHMPAVGDGVKQGIRECQHQFQHRRWNCTITGDETVFGPLTLIASRETAFTHAITAAGVSLAISRACRDGRLSSCGCSRASRPRHLHTDWVWGGCGDNLEYGYKFTEGFIDIRERERKVKRGSREQGRQLMNRHNNEAGRRAVIKKSRVTCKCHGVSGSCSLITCWQQLATFREIGDYLRDKYEGATEVKVSRRGKLRLSNPNYSLPTAQDLVYLEESPNYCIRNNSLGSFGTTGRECNRTSAGVDGCSLMCCGRGYNTKKLVVKERCECKFHWCCRVDCNTCVKTVEVYTCK